MGKVYLILADGMRPDGMLQCGHPMVEKLMQAGASTLTAQTVMPSVTLPCHMSLFHSVGPERHGVTTNVFTPQVRPVKGLFDRLTDFEKKCAFYYSWGELRDLHQPASVADARFIQGGTYTYEAASEELTEMTLQAREKGGHDFTFLYLGEVDDIGHRYGWMGKEYLQAVSHSFDCIARVYEAMDPEDLLIVTADHGGHQRSHGTDCPEDMTIPVLAVGGPFAPGSTLPETRIIDLAPTIAKFLGVPADADWEGHSLY